MRSRLPAGSLPEGEEIARFFDCLSTDSDFAATDTVRYVGGMVRDLILGLPISDIDCATAHPPEEVERRLKRADFRVIPTGIAHGTWTVLVGEHQVEITSLRRDVTTDGRRATVAFTCDWEEDARRRDFTINALSADYSGRVYDYTSGLEDLRAKRLRFIGDAHQRIREDALRLLRFFRFFARFSSGSPDEDALHACISLRRTLKGLSRERIRDELLKLLATDTPEQAIQLMDHHEILEGVYPEFRLDGRFPKLLAAERITGKPDAIRRLFTLFPSGFWTNMASTTKRLRISREEARRLCAIDAHLRQVSDEETRAEFTGHTQRFLYRWGETVVMDVAHLLSLMPEDLATVTKATRGWAGLRDTERPQFPLSGDDLVKAGVSKGKAVGEVKRELESLWVKSDFTLDQQSLLSMIKR